MKIDCVPAESGVRKPENTIIVQAGMNVLIMATVQDQEEEHHRDSIMDLVEMRLGSIALVTRALMGPR